MLFCYLCYSETDFFPMNSTICAPATASGGALGVLRLSGPEAIAITERVFRPLGGRPLRERPSHTLTFGHLLDATGGVLDEVLVSIFRAPHSFTGEESVEVSCHGSDYVLRTALERLCAAGAVPAAPGEFTQRAFLNGRMDLSQAEAVADVIAATTAAQHRVAMSQMRGAFTHRLATLREQLLHLTSLLELELDFSDHEDLEFADRSRLDHIAAEIERECASLAASFSTGNAIKRGLPVAIVGSTNAGKSTLLNALLHDERAIVSEVHGTTRDVVEDTYVLDGTLFRFIDTAGLRHTTDTVEQMGIERSWVKLDESAIVLFVVDATDPEEAMTCLAPEILRRLRGRPLLLLLNKSDRATPAQLVQAVQLWERCTRDVVASENGTEPSTEMAAPVAAIVLPLSARTGEGLTVLTTALLDAARCQTRTESDVVVTNARHHAALTAALADIRRVRHGLALQLSGDLIAQDLHEALFHLAEITGGQITSDEVLGNVFRHFCIGK